MYVCPKCPKSENQKFSQDGINKYSVVEVETTTFLMNADGKVYYEEQGDLEESYDREFLESDNTGQIRCQVCDAVALSVSQEEYREWLNGKKNRLNQIDEKLSKKPTKVKK